MLMSLIPHLNNKSLRILKDKLNHIHQENKVLVIMPTFNRPHKCINVINHMLKQTYKNKYLLVIDDGSIIDNYNIIDSYVNKLNNDRVILTRNPINIKIAKTINIGFKYFLENNYKFVTWISDDNEYYPNFISELVKLNGDFSYTGFDYQDLDKKIVRINEEYKNVEDLLNKFTACASFIKKIGFYDENFFGPEDYDYLIRTFLNINANNIKHSDISNMKYILHNECLSAKDGSRISNIANNIKMIYKVLIKNNKNHLRVLTSSDNIAKCDDMNKELVMPGIFQGITDNFQGKYKEIKLIIQKKLNN